MTDSWLPILIMLVLYSCIGLISALLMPEVRDRDLSLPEDAAEATAARSYATRNPDELNRVDGMAGTLMRFRPCCPVTFV